MKLKYALEAEESVKLRQMLEDMPVDLCDNITCPDFNGECHCDSCPITQITNILEESKNKIFKIIKQIEG